MSAQEIIAFRRAGALTGVEVLDARNTSRNWRIFNTGFGLAVPLTWHGEVFYRQQREIVGPGMVFCSEPGEIHTTTRIYVPGSFQALMIEAQTLGDYLSECDLTAAPRWRNVAQRMSPELSSRLHAVLRAVGRPYAPMQLQTHMVQLVRALVSDLVEGSCGAVARVDNTAKAAERVRECLHYEDGPRMDLQALAARTGLSRFQVVRSFKRRYGLPPHSYQLCVRIGRAQELLKAGALPANVALDCGFADQSHFTRLFRRSVGVTPGQYARSLGHRSGKLDLLKGSSRPLPR